MKKSQHLILLILLVVSTTTTGLALPNKDTLSTGDSCEDGHSFNYRYTFTYPDTMQVGETYNLKISFKISGSTVTRNPYQISTTVTGSGFTVSTSNLNLLTTNTVQITPNTQNPSISIETQLSLDGDERQHRGNEAVYKDTFKLTEFNIHTPEIEYPPDLVDNSTLIDPETNDNETEVVPPIDEGPIDSEPDPPIHVDNPLEDPDGVIDEINDTNVSGYQKDQVTKITIHANDQIITTFTVAVADISVIPWYIVRSTGLISFYLLSASIFIAILKKINPKKFSKLTKLHHEVSWMAVILSLLHGINNLIDSSIWNLSLSDVFWIDFSSTNSFYISLGVIGLYFIALVVLTSFKPILVFLRFKKWHVIHLASYLAYGVVILHSLMLGTDLSWLLPANNYSIFANYLFWLTTCMNITGIIFYQFTRNAKK